ncbi:MAG: hypothetical protein AB7S36_06915 [Planctomycetota bacterium]
MSTPPAATDKPAPAEKKADEPSKPPRNLFRRFVFSVPGIFIVLVLVLAGAGAWLFLAPVPYNQALFNEIEQRFRCDVPADQNGYHDYAKIKDVDASLVPSLADDIRAMASGALGKTFDNKLYQATWNQQAGQKALWDRAMSREQSRCDFPLDLSPDAPLATLDMARLVRLRLLATVDNADTYLATVRAMRHLIRMLTDRGSVVHAALGTVYAADLVNVTAAHLSIARANLTIDRLKQLDTEFDGLDTALLASQESLEAEFAGSVFAIKADAAAGSFPANVYIGAAVSRLARYVEVLITVERDARAMNNAEWRSQPSVDPATALSGFENFRMMIHRPLIETARPIYRGMVEQIRATATRVRLLRLALRICAWSAANGGKLLPDLDTLNVNPIGPPQIVDEWAGDAPYQYAQLSPEGGKSGFQLGSVGADGTWDGWPGEAAVDASAGDHIAMSDAARPWLIVPAR